MSNAEALFAEAQKKYAAKEYEQAMRLAAQAADMGNADAQNLLGCMYYSGVGTSVDPKKAADLFKKAAKQKNMYAQFNLGRCYEEGRGVWADAVKALELYRKSAEQGYVAAQLKLGLHYERGTRGFPLLNPMKDMYARTAMEWYSKAALQGDAAAMSKLGEYYLKGLGGNRDYAKALELFQKAAEQGDVAAIYNLGQCYENGYGVSQNLNKALELYDRAHGLGNPKADSGYRRLSSRMNGGSSAPSAGKQFGSVSASPGSSSAHAPKKEPERSEERTPSSVQEPRSCSAMDELNGLIGLGSVKLEVRKTIQLAKVQKMREEMGLKIVSPSRHLVFTGNPGTGKTTVARIIAQLYKDIGVLSKGHLVEVNRADLVAGYVGQTAARTAEKIREAYGGVLFIDEAYTLSRAASYNDFGQEAIDTLLKEMEDHRDDLLVIVAGYPDLMKQFISSNPGLSSRFSKYLHFPDYDESELMQIFEGMCRKYDLILAPSAKSAVAAQLRKIRTSRGINFGNARDVRNYFEAVLERQALRIADQPRITSKDILTIEAEDAAF